MFLRSVHYGCINAGNNTIYTEKMYLLFRKDYSGSGLAGFAFRKSKRY